MDTLNALAVSKLPADYNDAGAALVSPNGPIVREFVFENASNSLSGVKLTVETAFVISCHHPRVPAVATASLTTTRTREI